MPPRNQQLDQLDAMLNLVLEQTGRLFTDTARGNKAGAVAHGTRLKQILPKAMNGFHDALDQLEGDLILARTVLRRDYAVYRETRSTGATRQDASRSSMSISNVEPDTHMDEAPVSPGHASASDSKPVLPQNEHAAMETPTTGAPPEPAPEAKQQPPPQAYEIPDTDTDAVPNHMASQSRADSTASAYNNIDYDALFNDPDSEVPSNASPNRDAAAQNDSNTFRADDGSGAADFNFDPFGDDDPSSMQDPDAITSLLPGLENYANAGNEEMGLPMLDLTGDNDVGAGGADNGEGLMGHMNGAQVNGGAGMGDGRDTTFDDLMNLADFDMTGLDAGDGFESGNRFDESFFDI